MRHWGFSTWGIQTGPVTTWSADFVLKHFHLFTQPSIISPFVLPQREEGGKMGKRNSWKVNETLGFQYLGHSKWTICNPFYVICLHPVKLVRLVAHDRCCAMYSRALPCTDSANMVRGAWRAPCRMFHIRVPWWWTKSGRPQCREGGGRCHNFQLCSHGHE